MKMNSMLSRKRRGETIAAEEFQKQWPGFKVTCEKCGSNKVELSNSLGHSDESGSWGSLDFWCLECNQHVSIYES